MLYILVNISLILEVLGDSVKYSVLEVPCLKAKIMVGNRLWAETSDPVHHSPVSHCFKYF
jgi:hypothetical protein